MQGLNQAELDANEQATARLVLGFGFGLGFGLGLEAGLGLLFGPRRTITPALTLAGDRAPRVRPQPARRAAFKAGTFDLVTNVRSAHYLAP